MTRDTALAGGRGHRLPLPLFRAGLVAIMGVLLFGLVGCLRVGRLGPAAGAQMKNFVSHNFFSLDYPGDWVTRDLDDGANLFYADELIFVRIKILEPPEGESVSSFMDKKIKVDADVQGGQMTLVKSGVKGQNPYASYLITKPNGQRLHEVLIYNEELKLLYVLFGSSRPEDFDEFSRIFSLMFESFQFRVTARLPAGDGARFVPDVTTMSGTWVSYLEGLRTEDYDLLQKACARINGSKLINDAAVRAVKADYFPYGNPLYTFVSHVEVRDRIANVAVAVRALPPEGFLRHEMREFILEDDHWRLLRFDRAE